MILTDEIGSQHGLVAGSVFTGEPLKLAAGHFGLRRGLRTHAPDEYYLIESSDPRLHSFDAAVRSHVDHLFELAKRAGARREIVFRSPCTAGP